MRRPLLARHAAAAFVAVSLLSCGSAFGQNAVATSQTAVRVAAILEHIGDRQGTDYWTTIQQLASLGEDILPTVRQQIGLFEAGSAGDSGRLACAKILLEIGTLEDGDRALLILEDLLDKARDKTVRVAALWFLGLYGDPDEVQPRLEERLATTRDPEILIPLAKVLWELDHLAAARDALVQLLSASDLHVRREAALTLAEMGYFEGSVRDLVRELKNEPSEQGRRAASLERVMQLSRQLDRKLDDGELLLDGVDPAKLLRIKEEQIRTLESELKSQEARNASDLGPHEDKFHRLLEEVIEKTQELYVDEKKTRRERLFLAAIRGMVSSLDDFSSFMDVADTKRFHESMAGEYFGIGAHVQKPLAGGPLEIRKLLYGGPAHQAGLRSGDRVTAIDGESILKRSLDEVIGTLKGPANTKITLTVVRVGQPQPEQVVVVRGRVEVPSVYSETLPGAIGYISLTKFGDDSAEDFIRALDELQEGGLEGLIVDLRGNPGGRRDAAVRIADQFVDGELPIVTQKGRGGEEMSTPPDAYRRPNYPLVILVNGASASASEIVAGALQDYGRATIVGERTFGKGSVQRVVQMSPDAAATLGGEARLRLTVQYYYLPSGECIHRIVDEDGTIVERGGVDPDLEVKGERLSEREFLAREELQSRPEVAEYVAEHFEALKLLYENGDQRDLSRYPEAEALYERLQTSASRQDLSSVLRLLTRRRLEDDMGKDFACDYHDDRQLERGILKILEDLEIDPATIPSYRHLPERLAEEAPDDESDPESERP